MMLVCVQEDKETILLIKLVKRDNNSVIGRPVKNMKNVFFYKR